LQNYADVEGSKDAWPKHHLQSLEKLLQESAYLTQLINTQDLNLTRNTREFEKTLREIFESNPPHAMQVLHASSKHLENLIGYDTI
jgi:Asp-tRNA(Asn)/Glu-tRNA(Gln) amidotransferase B subunit